jgi:hypothetical protein
MTSENPFEELGKSLSPQHRAELFQVLHQAGIGPEDRDLAKLFRALQIYKAFYEEIPTRVSKAIEEAGILAVTLKALGDDITSHLDQALVQLERNTQTASLTAVEFRDTQARLAAAVENSAAQVAQSLESILRKSLETGLLKPFESSLNEVRNLCAQTARQAKQMTTELKLARRIHMGGYALAATVITLTLFIEGWFILDRHYTRREAELIEGIEQNRQMLRELARQGAVLQVQRDPADSEKLYLFMKRARTWTTDKYVVVEVK